jgi:hypothetical protein
MALQVCRSQSPNPFPISYLPAGNAQICCVATPWLAEDLGRWVQVSTIVYIEMSETNYS